MTKKSKIHRNLAPMCVALVPLNLNSALIERISDIELKYEFKDGYLLEGLNTLTYQLDIDKELARQKLRPSEEKKFLGKLKDATQSLLLLLEKASPQVRDKINDILIAKNFLTNKSTEEKRSAVPYIFENSLEIFEYACIYAISNAKPDNGGNRPHSSTPKSIIFNLIKIYSTGTGKKPSCYVNNAYSKHGFNGNFYHFLIELNPILSEINPEMDLGTPVTIGDYAKECLEASNSFTAES